MPRRAPRTPGVLALAAAAVLAAAFLAPAVADDGGRPLSATLTGAAEFPGPGDADGSGSATLRLNPGQEEICYTISVEGIAEPTAAHIHVGDAGASGPPVVTLATPAGGSVEECTEADRELIVKILQNPAGYYVNVHTGDFPDGAVRGQLTK
jgi:hypothetical protein